MARKKKDRHRTSTTVNCLLYSVVMKYIYPMCICRVIDGNRERERLFADLVCTLRNLNSFTYRETAQPSPSFLCEILPVRSRLAHCSLCQDSLHLKTVPPNHKEFTCLYFKCALGIVLVSFVSLSYVMFASTMPSKNPFKCNG